ncbi:MAG: TolC family protein [Nitrospirae bacterium]|nr:TolC family protein [Nitrospirota bacterium]
MRAGNRTRFSENKGSWRKIKLTFSSLFILALVLYASGCSTAHYRQDADKETYRIIRQKQKEALNINNSNFTIEQKKINPFGKPEPKTEKGKRKIPILSLARSLEIAVKDSREYQSKKEDLYLAALDLTYQKYKWGPRFNGSLSAGVTKQGNERYGTGGADFGLKQLLASGAEIGVDLGLDVLRYFTGDPRKSASSLLSLGIIQPLTRGAGRRIAQENLTQAERNVLYQVRSFARYQRTFTVQIATDYYRVLQQNDVVKNEFNNYQNLIESSKRSRLMAQAGRLPEFQVDQAKQNELRAKNRWIRVKEEDERLLDRFKITLGLPTDAQIILDESELTRLVRKGITSLGIQTEGAVKTALRNRLDLMNVRDQVEDAERQVLLAKNGLRTDVSLSLSADVNSAPPTSMTDFRFQKGTYSTKLNVGLPLNRRQERNTYRKSLISLDRQKRTLFSFEDNIKLEVRQAYRRLLQAEESYNIQKLSVTLAAKRVESTTLLLQAGRVNTRDLLDSQEAFLEAQNGLIGALVDHTIARLEFWRDIGTLQVNEKGLWQEETNNGE